MKKGNSLTDEGDFMPAPGASVLHYDPYKNFRFRVNWNGRQVAGISSVSALRRTTEVTKYRTGGNTGPDQKLPGRTEYEPITLERGLTQDTEFEDWANQVSRLNSDAAPTDFRKDILIEVYNEAGQLALAYRVYRCWVSEYQALPDLDANGNAVAIERIKLENEGWERIPTSAAPAETAPQAKER